MRKEILVSLEGESVVFTGELLIKRKEAADLAVKAGAWVDNNVKFSTTVLVVGDQDPRKTKGQKTSRKQRLAEQMGYIRIITEKEFRDFVLPHIDYDPWEKSKVQKRLVTKITRKLTR